MKPEQRKVSVIVPVYNSEKYLHECVLSLQKQTLSEIEIWLIDDGSTDASGRICDELAADDARIHVIHKQNEGAGLARNAGLAAAHGEYVAFVDSDDTVAFDMLEILYTEAKASGADMTMTGIRHVGGIVFKGEDVEKFGFEKREIFDTPKDLERLVLGMVGARPQEPEDTRYSCSVCKNLYRRAVIEENGIRFVSEREYASEDMLFLIDFVLCITRAVGIPGALYYYRRNGESSSKSYQSGRFERSKMLMAEAARRLERKIARKEFAPYCARQLQAYARVALSQEYMRLKAHPERRTEVNRNIRAILHDPALQEALRAFDIYKLPKKQAAFAVCMKYKAAPLVHLLIKMREKA